jgi:hypothetical protein
MMQKKVPLWILLLVVFLGINSMVLFGWAVDYASTVRGDRLGNSARTILLIARFPTMVHQAFAELFEDSPQLIQNPFPGVEGFKINGRVQAGAARDDGYLLLSAYDDQKNSSTVKLLRIRDEHVAHEWAPDIAQLASKQATVSSFFDATQFLPRRYRISHPLLMTDGGLAFADQGPLFRINACALPTQVVNGVFHHAKELDTDGNIWTSSTIEPATLDKRVFYGVRDDAIAQISPAGEVLLKRSVASILIDNGYGGLLLGVGNYSQDLVHLNAVRPALYSTKYWQKDDLLLSLRTLSTVLLYRPSTNKILWLKTGPWMKQHDPEFVGDSKISIFGNDVIDSPAGHAATFPNGANNIYVYDFENGSVSTPYTAVLARAKVRTITEGRTSILSNGDAIVEESNRGRTLRVSPDAVIWEYTAKANKKKVISVGAWSSYLTKVQAEQLLVTLKGTTCR